MDVIIFSGQSNMQGQSERLSDNTVIKGAYEYRYLTDDTVPLKNPVGENITYEMHKGNPITSETHVPTWLKTHVLGAACYGHTSLVPKFCETYVSTTQRIVLAVHAAKGSTKISEWLPGTLGYNALVRKSLGAIRKVQPQRIFFVWLQGESDAVAGVKKEAYKADLCVLCNALKADLGIDRFGIIRVGRFTNDARDIEIISAQDEICREDPDFLMLTDLATTLNQSKENMHPTIKGHYSAKGLEHLGCEAAKALCRLA